MTKIGSKISDYWLITYKHRGTVRRTTVYGVCSDDAIKAANKVLNREGGYNMRRLSFAEVANYLATIMQ